MTDHISWNTQAEKIDKFTAKQQQKNLWKFQNKKKQFLAVFRHFWASQGL